MREVTLEVLAESSHWKQVIPSELGIRVAVKKEAFRRQMKRLYVIKFSHPYIVSSRNQMKQENAQRIWTINASISTILFLKQEIR